MHFSTILPAVMALASTVSAQPPHGPPHYPGQGHHDHGGNGGDGCSLTEAQSYEVVHNYLHLWNTGDFSTIDKVLALNMVYYQDRIPSGTGHGGSFVLNINSSTAWSDFVTNAREGWTSYTFDVLYQFYQGNRIAARWLHTEISNHTGLSRNVPADHAVRFNGTDLITVDCEGLIVEVDSAQNYIQEYHGLKINLGVV